MGRIITLSMAVLLTVGETGAALSGTLGQNGVAAARPARYLVRNHFGGGQIFVPPGYGRRMGIPPNPDAPGRSQLDPGLHYDTP